MTKHAPLCLAILIPFSLCICKCTSKHNSADIVANMNHYDRLLEKMNLDSIALQYTPDGELGDAARGRDSIRNFLQTFSAYRVLSNQSITDSVSITGDTAFQSGTYKQVTILPSKDTASLKGAFKVRWIWDARDGWKIARMTTKPIQ